jgi:hypothetical protein
MAPGNMHAGQACKKMEIESLPPNTGSGWAHGDTLSGTRGSRKQPPLVAGLPAPVPQVQVTQPAPRHTVGRLYYPENSALFDEIRLK